MDAEAWNEKVNQMNAASVRSVRMGELSLALGRSAALAAELGVEAVAAQLCQLEADTFHMAALAPSHAGDLETELEAARDAGDEPA
jgi:hypothetical protein